MFFTTETRVPYYECDCNNQMKISAALKRMQQTSSEQLEHLGFSVERLYAEDMVFLLSKMCVKVHRMPVCSERLVVGTAPTTPRGARFVREFVIESPGGERLLSAFSLWVLVNPATRKILRPASFPYPMKYQKESLGEIVDDMALPKPEGLDRTRKIVQVGYSHIDVNHHVNNTVYADFICDALPYHQLARQGIDMLVIHYQNEARWGETIEIATTPLPGNEFFLEGQHGGKPCFQAMALLKDQLNENNPAV